MSLDRSPFEQDTVTGQGPGVVRVPTFHLHDTAPVLDAVLSPSPAAVALPDLYLTSIEHEAPAFVFTAAVARAPRRIGDVNFVNFSGSTGSAVGSGSAVESGSAVGSGVGAAVGSGVGAAVGSGVGAAVGSGVGATTEDAMTTGTAASGEAVGTAAVLGVPDVPPAIADSAKRLTIAAPTMTAFWRCEAPVQAVLRNDNSHLTFPNSAGDCYRCPRRSLPRVSTCQDRRNGHARAVLGCHVVKCTAFGFVDRQPPANLHGDPIDEVRALI
jgi:hypothetical protein